MVETGVLHGRKQTELSFIILIYKSLEDKSFMYKNELC